MKFNRVLLGSAGVLAAMGTQGAFAAGPTISEVLTNSGVVANGWISGSYAYTGNDGNDLALRTFDERGDTFRLNQAVLNLSMLPTEGFGGMVTLLAGQDAVVINNSYGDGSGNNKFTVNQAYFQYATGALTIIGGRYNTLAGAEVIADPLNANISRSFLFTLAEPFVHTGVRASYKVADTFTAYLGVVNSGVAGQSDDNDHHKTVELGGYFTPTSAIGIGVYDYYGREADGFKNNYLDVVATFQATPQLQLVLNADWQKQTNKGAAPDPENTGFAAYANYKINDLYRVSLRLEALELDPDDGGSKEHLKEATLTFGYSPAKNFDLLLEGRLDDAKHDIFPDGTADTDDSQTDVAIKAIYKFGL